MRYVTLLPFMDKEEIKEILEEIEERE